jgi:hypothetical protein
MEGFFAVLILVAIFALPSILRASSHNRALSDLQGKISSNPFRVSFSKDSISLDTGDEIEVLSVKVKGFIKSQATTIVNEDRVFLGLSLSSQTTGTQNEPVLCMLDDLQATDSTLFNYVSDPLTAHNGLAGGWDEWVQLIAVPIDSLVFSRKGLMTLKLQMKVLFKAGRSFSERSIELKHFRNEKSGYIDSHEQREKGKEIAVTLAVLIAGSDGDRAASEGEVIKTFIRKQIASESEEDRAKTKKTLNQAVEYAHAITSPKAIKLRAAELADQAADFDADIKFEIIELLLDVASVDDVAAKQETDFLDDLARRIGLDLDEYKNIRDKALPISIYESDPERKSAQIEGMLGLTNEMSVAEKKTQLSKEYRKWNALKHSSDKAKSKQAKDMVTAIGELRRTL